MITKDNALKNSDSRSELATILYKNNIIDKRFQNEAYSFNYNANQDHKITKYEHASTEIVLPDFWKDCEKVERDISAASSIKPTPKCQNISIFTEQTVKKDKRWSSYITPLTPGFPSLEAFKIQYFSPNSTDSWIGKNETSNTNVSLLGIYNGIVRVKKGLVCSIKPNPLGLSDIVVDDFVICNKLN